MMLLYLQKLWFDTQKLRCYLKKNTCFDLVKEQLSYYPYFLFKLGFGGRRPWTSKCFRYMEAVYETRPIDPDDSWACSRRTVSLSAFHCIVPCKRGSIWHKQDRRNRRNSIPTLHPSICDCMLEHQTVLDPSATAKFKNLSDFWAQTFLIHPIHPSQTILLQLRPFISYKYL